jgi:N-acyl homoserine lactone hydrolase
MIGNVMKLYVIPTGELTHTRTILTGLAGVGQMITLPIPTYLVEHPRGLVLIDTGMRCDNKPDFFKALEKISPVWASKNGDLVTKLQAIGYSPDQIKYVILTHMHIDHAGYIDSFPKSTFFIQKDELNAALWPLSFEKLAYYPGDWTKLKDLDIVALEGDWDLFGDGSVKMFRTIGHSRGHQSVIVTLPKTGSVILPADAAALPEILEGGTAGILWNAEEFVKSVRRLKLEQERTGGQIFFSHDLEQFKTLKLSPAYYE